MASKNDITGDSIRSKINSKTGYDAYREGWDRIFGGANVRQKTRRAGTGKASRKDR